VRGGANVHAAPKPKRFDTTDLLATLDGNQDALDEILRRFRKSMPDSLNALDRAISDYDFTAAKKIVHSIKGAALNMGAGEMAQEAAVADSLSAHSNATAFVPIAKKLRAAFAVLEVEIS
jgi:HPt (histidine-containing phosphotransfer) domain-containing protein